jgi:hypothetical protein
MENPSESSQWRVVARKSETTDVGNGSFANSEDAVVFDLTKFFLEARMSAIDDVRQCYSQAVARWSSSVVSRCSPPSSSPPRHRSTTFPRTTDRDDVAPAVFPIVTGPIGSGTSQVIHYALNDEICQERGGYYVHVKFDMRQHADPHRPFVVAWTAFAEEVVFPFQKVILPKN